MGDHNLLSPADEITIEMDVKDDGSSAQEATLTPGSLFIDSYAGIQLLPKLNQSASSYQPMFSSSEQATETFKWLTATYQSCEGFSLPKSVIYDHYTAFCKEQNFTPVNATVFGKVIRNAFPGLGTRRLGARSQSRYHYYGIRMKSSSDDTQPSTTRQGDSFLVAPNQVQPSKAFMPSPRPQHLGSALNLASATLLPEFPDASNLKLTHGVEAGQVNYLISSYRSHCIQVLETVLRGGLNGVGFLIEHFWQHLNESIKGMLYHVYLGDTIAVCDTHLYHTIINVLIPGAVQPLPAPLLRAVRNFACYHVSQVEKALKGLPDHLINAKLTVAKRFASMLSGKTTLAHLAQASQGILCSESNNWHMKDDWEKRTEQVPDCTQTAWYFHPFAKRFASMLSRKTTLAHLAQASRGILCSESNNWHMKDDWEKRTEQVPDCTQTAWTSCDEWGLDAAFIREKLEEYSKLLDAGQTVEDHIHWLEMLVKGLTDHIEVLDAKRDALRSLLLQWTYLSNLLIRDQTLRSAVSFGSFHLLNLLYQEYLMYVADIHNARMAEGLLWKKVFGQQSEASPYFLTQPMMCDLEECNLSGRRYSALGGPKPCPPDTGTRSTLSQMASVSDELRDTPTHSHTTPAATSEHERALGPILSQPPILKIPTPNTSSCNKKILRTPTLNIPTINIHTLNTPTLNTSSLDTPSHTHTHTLNTSQTLNTHTPNSHTLSDQFLGTTLMPVEFSLDAPTPVPISTDPKGSGVVPPSSVATQSMMADTCVKPPQPRDHKAPLNAGSTSQPADSQTSLILPMPSIPSMVSTPSGLPNHPGKGGSSTADQLGGSQTPLRAPEPGVFEPSPPMKTARHQMPAGLYTAPNVTTVHPATARVSKPLNVTQPPRVIVQHAKRYQVRCPQHVISGGSCQRELIKILPMPSTLQQPAVGKAGDATRTLEPVMVKILGSQPVGNLKGTTEQVLLSKDGKSIFSSGSTSDKKPSANQMITN